VKNFALLVIVGLPTLVLSRWYSRSSKRPRPSRTTPMNHRKVMPGAASHIDRSPAWKCAGAHFRGGADHMQAYGPKVPASGPKRNPKGWGRMVGSVRDG
jgi:hypothetical protein